MPGNSPKRPTTERADFYADPLVYDILHAGDTATEVAAVERIARRHLERQDPLTWLEPACGTGRYLRALAAKGHTGIGFDLSADMVGFAQATAKRERVGRLLTLFEADMRSFDRGRKLPPVDVAFNLINTIRHLSSDAAMLAHLRAISRTLRPGGIYIVGLSMCAYGCEQETEDVWTGRRGSTTVTQVVQYLPSPGSEGKARNERVVSHLTVKTPIRTRHIDSTYTLRGYDLAQWREMIGKSAMRILATTDSDGRPAACEIGYQVWVLGHK